jgi:hypothetical protein
LRITYSTKVDVHISTLIAGFQFNKLLVIRQAIGRGLTAPNSLIKVKEAKDHCAQGLAEILSFLLPKSSPTDLRNGATKFLEKAVALRKMMTEEQAIYRCFMFNRGDEFVESQMDVEPERQGSGKMLFCTFPGLHRVYQKEETKENLTRVIAKASGEIDFLAEIAASGNNAAEKPSGQQPVSVQRM